MDAEKRRLEIGNMLRQSEKTIKGTELAKSFGVSRQVIVQDIAILRAEGLPVIATPNGYMMVSSSKDLVKKVAVKHGRESTGEELQVMLDYGARILDVIVEHPIYGEIQGVLGINCKADLDNFIQKLEKAEIEPLASLTDGIHIHTVEVPNQETYDKMIEELRQRNFLA